MKAYIVYDSAYGNTKAVAEAIAASLKPLNAGAVSVADFDPGLLSGGDLLVVGSPINGWRPTPKITELLAQMGNDNLKGINAAAFDTRVRFFIHGDAAKKITKLLKEAGANIISDPVPFYVQGTEGPLRSGELEKAGSWAKTLSAALER
ncbi:flavodoxin [Pseudarthrobacter psychrotolerans]|uniref:Flavodoxin n=1 Tax=Pseudarthrobacter psychrotolerans TaxID=2697569 RepID=A0A6P1NQE2_9MICC|nr:flavodoxin domain-containing protein [Pseudarthrobacter psychrotolerans]QHK19001.1 flavodoxin [Pseudarthrobacter psychrotolerans]